MVVLVPLSLSLFPFPLFNPALILPVSLSPAVRPFPLCILCLLSVRVISRPPPPASFDSPSSVRWVPLVASSGVLKTNQLPAPGVGFRRPAFLVCHRPMRLVVLGFGVGWGGVEDGAPRDCP